MTLLQALAKSEELDCPIVNRKAGLKISAHDVDELCFDDLPKEGWEFDDTPMPIAFEAEYLGSDIMMDINQKPLGTVYSFTGSHVSHMPANTKVKVTLEPIP